MVNKNDGSSVTNVPEGGAGLGDPAIPDSKNSETVVIQQGENRGSGPLRRVYTAGLVAAAAASVAFQTSPLNESMRIEQGFQVLVETGSPWAVAGRILLVTAAIESVPAVFISLALSSKNPTIQKAVSWAQSARASSDDRKIYWKKKKDSAKLKENEPLSENNAHEQKDDKKTSTKTGRLKNFLGDLSVSLGLGAGFTVLKNSSREGMTLKKHLLVGAQAIVAIGTVSSAIAYLVSGGVQNAKLNIPLTDYTLHFEKQAKWLIDYGTDTKALMAFFLALQMRGLIKGSYRRFWPGKEAEFQAWLQDNERVSQT